MNLEQELKDWLDQRAITSDIIGSIRRACFMPWDSEWNSLVRDETALRENKPSVLYPRFFRTQRSGGYFLFSSPGNGQQFWKDAEGTLNSGVLGYWKIQEMSPSNWGHKYPPVEVTAAEFEAFIHPPESFPVPAPIAYTT